MDTTMQKMREFESFVLRRHNLRLVAQSDHVTLYDRDNEIFCRVSVRRGSNNFISLRSDDVHVEKQKFLELIRFHIARGGNNKRTVKNGSNQCQRKRCFEHFLRAFPHEWRQFFYLQLQETMRFKFRLTEDEAPDGEVTAENSEATVTFKQLRTDPRLAPVKIISVEHDIIVKGPNTLISQVQKLDNAEPILY